MGADLGSARMKWILAALAVALALDLGCCQDGWQTRRHESGFCAMQGICGYRKDGDPLNCANNTIAPHPAPPLAAKLARVCPSLYKMSGGARGQYCCSEEQLDTLDKSTSPAKVLTVGCPACYHNFMHFWCLLTCSSDQAVWTNVTSVQQAPSNNATAVQEVSYWWDPQFGNGFYDSCKDMKMGSTNMPVMSFLGGGAKDAQQFLDFLGLLKDKRPGLPGSPFQQNFLPGAQVPAGMGPLDYSLPSCADPQYRCSCGDCPSNPTCKVPDDKGGEEDVHCHVGALTCLDLGLLVFYAVIVGSAGALYMARQQSRAIAATDEQQVLLDDLRPRSTLMRWFSHAPRTTDEDDYPVLPQPTAPLMRGGASMHYPYAERKLQPLFYHLGLFCALRPKTVMLWALLGVAACCLGLLRFSVQTSPLALWVGPGSAAARDKQRFDAAFGAFYRVEQLILSSTPTTPSPYASNSPGHLPAIVTEQNIALLFDLQEAVDGLSVQVEGGRNVSLTDICFKPFGDVCASQSLLQFWKMSRSVHSSMLRMHKDYAYCFLHWSTDCRATFEAPVDPSIVTGGFPKGKLFRNFSADATALVVTYPVNSAPELQEDAIAWERAFIQLAKTKLTQLARDANLTLSFSSESSVQDELARESYTDASTVAVSYLVMLLYIALALWKLPDSFQPYDFLLTSRVGLGLVGVVIVAASVAGALGLVSMLGFWSTLIIMEVIPFLVLAVGVDNMFVLAHALQRQAAGEQLPERVARALAEAGPSIALAAACEVIAFGLGALTPMPAVRNFSLCASLAVLLDFMLQVTAFVAYLAMDTARLESGKPDCAVWAGDGPTTAHSDFDEYQPMESSELLEPLEPNQDGELPLDEPFQLPPSGNTPAKALEPASLHRLLQSYMERVHVPLVVNAKAVPVVLALFLGGLLLSLAGLERLQVGLDQRVALPKDSYLQAYFADLMASLRVGPPLYFVLNGLNVTSGADINRVCSVSGCNDDSMLSQITAAAMQPSRTYIATPAASWIDDYLSWINPEVPSCCRQKPLPSGAKSFCDSTSRDPGCTACYDFDHLVNGTRPNLKQMQETLPGFLAAKPSQSCAKGGAGVYTTALEMDAQQHVAGLERGVVKASSFRTYYPPLNTQHDFIHGLRQVQGFVAQLRSKSGLDVYAYAVHHVFFEQYLYVWRDARLLLGLPLLAIFGITCLMTSSVWTGAILLLVLVSLLLHLAGSMFLAGIQLNAVSLVNLAMALGIAVEFCAHVLHAFVVAPGSRMERAAEALNKVGASVLSGITLTKFVGVTVLAFAQTQIFTIYYFRLYLALVLLGAAHGLVLLPVLLAVMGPPTL